jgi:hypothetical protein
MSGVPSVVNLKPRTLLTVFWDAFTHSGKSLSVDDNYRCSKGLRSTHSRARSHQDGADLRADRSTAYLVSCIRVRSAHGNSLDHLVSDGEHAWRNCEAERLGDLEVDQ